MKAILVFIDGTTCDMRHRIPLQGTPDFFAEENILKDIPTPRSVACMNELAKEYHLIYIGARPSEYNKITKQWFQKNGFPDGEVFCGKNQGEGEYYDHTKKGADWLYPILSFIRDRLMAVTAKLNTFFWHGNGSSCDRKGGALRRRKKVGDSELRVLF